jgi:hypothetical protein
MPSSPVDPSLYSAEMFPKGLTRANSNESQEETEDRIGIIDLLAEKAKACVRADAQHLLIFATCLADGVGIDTGNSIVMQGGDAMTVLEHYMENVEKARPTQPTEENE